MKKGFLKRLTEFMTKENTELWFIKVKVEAEEYYEAVHKVAHKLIKVMEEGHTGTVGLAETKDYDKENNITQIVIGLDKLCGDSAIPRRKSMKGLADTLSKIMLDKKILKLLLQDDLEIQGQVIGVGVAPIKEDNPGYVDINITVRMYAEDERTG
jgi:hypothetical protein